MGKGKRLRNTRQNKLPRIVRVHITFQENELLALNSEEELEKLFKEKSESALNNLKVDLKNFLKQKNAQKKETKAS